MAQQGIILLNEGQSSLAYFPSFATKPLFQQLKAEIPWNQRQIKMFGKTHDEPRLTAWFGPAYSYSGVHQPEKCFPEFIEELRIELCKTFQFPFNGVLLNYYRHGNDYMGWHRDNEKSMDQRCIASISFGAARKFSIRNIQTKEKTDILLEDGSLLLMQNLQTNWQHCLPKSSKILEERINLTFRHIVPTEPPSSR